MSGQMPAARPTDPTAHGVPAAPGTGAPTVLLDGLPAWRTMVDTHLCPAPPPPPHGPEKIYLGSTTVLINDQMACRMGDILQGLGPPNPVMMGSPTVLIGDVGFGMGAEDMKVQFAASALVLLQDWESLESKERLGRIQVALNNAHPAGMPRVAVRVNLFLPASHLGQFAFRHWCVDLNPDVLKGAMNEERMRRLVNTAYHEGRHAEQWWNAAQHRAALGDSAEEIRNSMRLPEKVANAAIDNPASTGTAQGAMGEVVHTSVYGTRRAYRNDVLANPRDPDKYRQYRALPEEEDAWRHGDSTETELRALAYRARKQEEARG